MSLKEKTLSLFAKTFGYHTTLTIQAPGRVNLIGEHTDYNDGFVLPCAIDYQTAISGAPRSDRIVRVIAADYDNQQDSFSLDAPIVPHATWQWSNYVRGVIKHLQTRNAHFNGADLVISGNVPQGAGLSSSASLEVAVGTVFQQEGIAVVDWLRLAAPHARRVASICGGAMLLAQSGLLNGRRATTHWKLLETVQATFPEVKVEAGPLYIQDGPIWTSGGVSSGFDLTLALVEEDYGFSLARDIAQDLVMYLHRPGSQLQFSRYNLRQTGNAGPIGDLQMWILDNITADIYVEALAEKVAMSPRNFTRVFTRETGVSTARYVS